MLEWFVDPGEIETLLIFLRDGRLRIAGDLTVLDQPQVASVMKGQWRHPRLLRYAQAHAVSLSSGSAFDAALETGRDLVVATTPEAATASSLLSIDVLFPDVRRMVRERRFDVRQLLALRRAARPLRDWLQQPGARDVGAFVELHRSAGQVLGATTTRLNVRGDLAGRLEGWSPLVFASDERSN